MNLSVFCCPKVRVRVTDLVWSQGIFFIKLLDFIVKTLNTNVRPITNKDLLFLKTSNYADSLASSFLGQRNTATFMLPTFVYFCFVVVDQIKQSLRLTKRQFRFVDLMLYGCYGRARTNNKNTFIKKIKFSI